MDIKQENEGVEIDSGDTLLYKYRNRWCPVIALEHDVFPNDLVKKARIILIEYNLSITLKRQIKRFYD